MNSRSVQGHLMDSVEPLDLVNYGLIPEFLGRFPNIISTKSLEEDQMVQVLTEPKHAIIKQYQVVPVLLYSLAPVPHLCMFPFSQYLFAMSGVEFHVTEEGLRAVARKAMAKKTGARGLRSILEKVLMEAMFVVPSEEGRVSAVYVDSISVEDPGATPLLIMQPLTLKAFLESTKGTISRDNLPNGVQEVDIGDYSDLARAAA